MCVCARGEGENTPVVSLPLSHVNVARNTDSEHAQKRKECYSTVCGRGRGVSADRAREKNQGSADLLKARKAHGAAQMHPRTARTLD